MLMVRCVVYSTADFVVGGVPGSTITFSNPVFDWLGSGAIAGIPSSGVLLGLCAVGFAFLLKQTALGRSIIAIGANPEIARLAGINVPRILVITYSLMGMLSAFGGILLAARLSSVSPLMGIGYELDIVTIVIVGGASLSGGRGSVWGTVFAAVLIAIIDSGLNMLNVPSFVQYLVKSTILLSAVILDRAYHARTQA